MDEAALRAESDPTRTARTFESYGPGHPVRDEWAELCASVGSEPFAEPGWIEAWHSAFGRRPLSLLTLRRGGRLVALMPLVEGRTAFRSPTNWHTPLFGAVSESVVDRMELIRSLLGSRRRWIDLSFLDEDDPLLGALNETKERGWRVVSRTLLRSPRLPLDGDWDSYEAGLSSGFRSQLARRARSLARRGEVSFEWTDGGERLGALLDEGLAVEGSGWKAERGTAILSRPEVEAFYRRIAEWAAERGWLRLGFLRLDGQAIAFDLSLGARGTLYWLKGGFDPTYHTVSPGMLLKRHQIQRAFEDGFETYDFLGGADPHKLRWTTTTRSRVRLQAFPRSLLGEGGFVVWRYGRPAAKRIRDGMHGLRAVGR